MDSTSRAGLKSASALLSNRLRGCSHVVNAKRALCHRGPRFYFAFTQYHSVLCCGPITRTAWPLALGSRRICCLCSPCSSSVQAFAFSADNGTVMRAEIPSTSDGALPQLRPTLECSGFFHCIAVFSAEPVAVTMSTTRLQLGGLVSRPRAHRSTRNARSSCPLPVPSPFSPMLYTTYLGASFL